MTPDVTGTFAYGGSFDSGDGTGPHPYWHNAAAGYYLWSDWGCWMIVQQAPSTGTVVSAATWVGPHGGDNQTGMLGTYNPGAGATGTVTIT